MFRVNQISRVYQICMVNPISRINQIYRIKPIYSVIQIELELVCLYSDMSTKTLSTPLYNNTQM